MLGGHFYNNGIKKTMVAFASLFNDINVMSGNEPHKVPLFPASRRKFLDRILSERSVDSDGRRGSLKATFPMMSYSIESLEKDQGQPFSPFQRNIIRNSESGFSKPISKTPYKITFNLNIISVERDETFQIIEQILPYFNPSFTVKIVMLESKDIDPIEKDLVFVLNSVSIDDSTEGDFLEDDLITSTLSFTTGVNFYSNPELTSGNYIKRVIFEEAKPQRKLTFSLNPIDANKDDIWSLDFTETDL